MTNVRSYTDKELLDKVKSLESYKSIPDGYWLLGVRSKEDATNLYDDKFYLFNKEKCIIVTTGTTNKGLNGTAVTKSNEWYYDSFIRGLHKGKMPAFRQHKPIKFYRDTNKDGKTDQVGKVYYENVALNIHGCDYTPDSQKTGTVIGGWSEGCAVMNIMQVYNKIMKITQPQNILTYVLIDEF